MGFRLGTSFLGSPTIEISEANHQVVPLHPQGWNRGYNFYRFDFINRNECSVKINGSENPIHLTMGQNFSTTQIDAPIHSFIIVDPNVEFSWIGYY